MSALACRAAHVFAGERTSLKRPRGVVDVATVACGKMAQEKFARRVVATKPSAPPSQNRARCDFDVEITEGSRVWKVHVVFAPPPRHLEEQKDGARILAAPRLPEARSEEEEAAAKRRRKSSSSSRPAAQAAHQRAEPAAKLQQPLPDQQRQSPMSKLIEKGKEALKRRRLEEIAREREKFRQELLEVEKAAMPDETIYPEELEELGLTAFQYAVTPTRKQAQRRAG